MCVHTNETKSRILTVAVCTSILQLLYNLYTLNIHSKCYSMHINTSVVV